MATDTERSTVANNRPKLKAYIYDKRGRLLSEGDNSYVKTHTYQAALAKATGQSSRIYLHAEISAIIRNRSGHKPYRIRIERYGRQGTPLLARPCEICQEALRKSGIKYMEYTSENGLEYEGIL